MDILHVCRLRMTIRTHKRRYRHFTTLHFTDFTIISIRIKSYSSRNDIPIRYRGSTITVKQWLSHSNEFISKIYLYSPEIVGTYCYTNIYF